MTRRERRRARRRSFWHAVGHGLWEVARGNPLVGGKDDIRYICPICNCYLCPVCDFLMHTCPRGGLYFVRGRWLRPFPSVRIPRLRVVPDDRPGG